MRDWRGWSSDTLDLQRPQPPPFRTGDPAGRGAGDRGGDPVDPPHAEYPARRAFVCRAARLITGPSTNGSWFVLWEAGDAEPATSVFVASDLPRREL